MPSVSAIVGKMEKSEIKCAKVGNAQQKMTSGKPGFEGTQQASCPQEECLWKIISYNQEKPISPQHAFHVTFKMKAQVMCRKFLVHKYHVVLS